MPSTNMVTYQEWTAIYFEVAARKGLRTGGPGGQRNLAGGRSFSGDEPQNRLMTAVAAVWQQNKEFLQDASHADARGVAEQSGGPGRVVI